MVKYEIPMIFYFGAGIVFVLLFLGLYLVLKKDDTVLDVEKKKHWSSRINSLQGDEKRIFQLLMDSDGTLFQSEIVEKSELSKVKVTRILDKLESKNLLDRRRRGLTNIVVLK